jgi:threonine/homoserine/homoserine lactone efflux protein
VDYIQILGFAFIALLLVISPGPNGLLIAKTVPAQGKKAGFSNVLGFLAAFYLHGALSILGISVLLTKSAEAFFIVKVVGALYLSWIGVKSLISAYRNVDIVKVKTEIRENQTLKKSFLEGFFTNVLNPKVSMFYLAAFPQFIPAGENSILYAFLLVTIHSVMNVFWFSSMVVLLSRLSSITKNGLFQRILKSVTGIVFIGFGVKLMTLESK